MAKKDFEPHIAKLTPYHGALELAYLCGCNRPYELIQILRDEQPQSELLTLLRPFINWHSLQHLAERVELKVSDKKDLNSKLNRAFRAHEKEVALSQPQRQREIKAQEDQAWQRHEASSEKLYRHLDRVNAHTHYVENPAAPFFEISLKENTLGHTLRLKARGLEPNATYRLRCEASVYPEKSTFLKEIAYFQTMDHLSIHGGHVQFRLLLKKPYTEKNPLFKKENLKIEVIKVEEDGQTSVVHTIDHIAAPYIAQPEQDDQDLLKTQELPLVKFDPLATQPLSTPPTDNFRINPAVVETVHGI